MNRQIFPTITSIWKKFENDSIENEIKQLNAKEFILVLIKLAQHKRIIRINFIRTKNCDEISAHQSFIWKLFCCSWIMHVFMSMNFNGVIDVVITGVFIIDVFITTGAFRAIFVVFSAEKILDLITWLNVSLSFEHLYVSLWIKNDGEPFWWDLFCQQQENYIYLSRRLELKVLSRFLRVLLRWIYSYFLANIAQNRRKYLLDSVKHPSEIIFKSFGFEIKLINFFRRFTYSVSVIFHLK